MNILLYIQATGRIVGRVDRVSRIEEEINNLCQSELGGVAGDYVPVKAPDRGEGETWEIKDGKATLVPSPKFVAKRLMQDQVEAKLQGLGLTPDEAKVIVAG
jgi:hypothetical protein